MTNVLISEGGAYRDAVRTAMSNLVSGLRALGLLGGAAIPHRMTRHVVISIVIFGLFFAIVHPIEALERVGFDAKQLVLAGFILCTSYIAAWLTEEQKRKKIDVDSEEGRQLARKILDLRLTAVLAGFALCMLVPLAFWKFQILNENFNVEANSSPAIVFFCNELRGCYVLPSEAWAWIVYCLQLYLTALPIFDATDVYNLNFSGIEASQTLGLHFALVGRLCFDVVLLTIIFGGLKDTRQQIGIAMARLEDTPDPSIRIGPPIIEHLAEAMKTSNSEDSREKKRFGNAVFALGSIQRSESAGALWDYLGASDPSAEKRAIVGNALSRIGAPAASIIRKFLLSEIAEPENVLRPIEAMLDGFAPIATTTDLQIIMALLKTPRNVKIALKTMEIVERIPFNRKQSTDVIEDIKRLHTRLPGRLPSEERSKVQARGARLIRKLERQDRRFFGAFFRRLTA